MPETSESSKSADASANGETPNTDASVQLPDDHPLVKTLAEQKKTIKDLRTKSQRLDEIEEAKKSEAEKAADRISKAEAEVATVPSKVADALRGHLVELHGIDSDDAELFLTAENPELLLKQVKRLIEQADSNKSGTRVPHEGRTPNPTPPDDRREFADFLTGNQS